MFRSSTRAKGRPATPPAPAAEGVEAAPPAPVLGPAIVVGAEGGEVQAHVAGAPEGLVTVTSALAVPYEIAVGDVLLVIGLQGRYYAIGVIHGQSRSVLQVAGDLDLQAGGKLTLTAQGGIEVQSPEVTIRAGRLRTLAEKVEEKAETAYRWIRRRLDLRAGEVRRVVEGEDYTQAKRSTTLAEGVVKVDGSSIQLGH